MPTALLSTFLPALLSAALLSALLPALFATALLTAALLLSLIWHAMSPFGQYLRLLPLETGQRIFRPGVGCELTPAAWLICLRDLCRKRNREENQACEPKPHRLLRRVGTEDFRVYWLSLTTRPLSG